MRRLQKRKGMYGKKRNMYKLSKKAKRRAFRACEWLWETLSFSMLAIGVLLIVGCEESVKLDTIALMQVVKYIISGLLLMFVGMMMQRERC